MNNTVLAAFIFVVFLTLSNGANVKEQDLEKINQFLLGEGSHNEALTSGKEKRETRNGPNKKKSKNNKRKKGMGHNKRKQNKNKTKQKQGKKIRKQRGRGKAKKGKGSRKLKNQVRNSERTKKTKKPSPLNSCSRQTSTFCPIEKASSLKVLYNQVANFKKQLKRAQNHVKIVKKKKEKSNVFEKDAAIVKDVVGGNLTAPTCPGTAGAPKSASEAASKGNMLLSCKQDITTSCKEITINSTLTGSCTETMDTFEAKVNECKTDDSCTCWSEAFAMKPSIISCNAFNEADAVKTKKKTCLKTFSGCKKAQDSAVEVAATCPDPVSQATTTTAPLATTSKVPPMSNTTAGPTTTPEMEAPVTMIFETPVNMTAGEAPIVMTMETPVEMTQTASTKAASRKERFVQDFMLKSLKNYFVRT